MSNFFFFLILYNFHPLEPTQPPIQWVLQVLSLGVKWPWCEADHSPPSSTKVRNVWSYTSIPPYVFMAWYSVKHRDNFTFTLPYDFHHQIKKKYNKLITLLTFLRCIIPHQTPKLLKLHSAWVLLRNQ